MQKFTDGDEPLCDRSNVVVMVDEAHRGQYGMTEKMDENGKVSVGAARVVRKALPNASYIGFTGTPVALQDRNTREIFGDYIDVYDMTQSVEDESTKPVYYESRVVALKLDEGTLAKLDAAYAKFAAQADEASVEKAKRDTGGLDAIFGAPETVDALCRDIVEHYENNRADVLTGKGAHRGVQPPHGDENLLQAARAAPRMERHAGRGDDHVKPRPRGMVRGLRRQKT